MADQTAANIVSGVTAKASGTAPVAPTTDPKTGKAVEAAPVDPNAGKEKYIVDGKERYLSPQEARAYVQKGLAFEPKMSELDRLQKETSLFLDTLKSDPAKILFNPSFGQPEEILEKIMGSTKVSDRTKSTIGQWYYNNVVAREAMSPEQREHLDAKEKLAQYEAQEKQRQNEELGRENDAKVQQALNQIKAQINEAMSEAGVPLDSKIAPQLAQRVARVMQLGYVAGKTITPKEAMAKVKAEMSDYQKAYYDMLDEDKLVEQLGKENAEKVRKYYLKAVKEKEEKKTNKDFAAAPKRDVRKTMTSDEFHDYLAELKQKGK